MKSKITIPSIALFVVFMFGLVKDSKAFYWANTWNVILVNPSYQYSSAITSCDNLKIRCDGELYGSSTFDSTSYIITGNNIYINYYWTGAVCYTNGCGCLYNYMPLDDTLMLPFLPAGTYQIHIINNVKYFWASMNNILADTNTGAPVLVNSTIINSPIINLSSSSSSNSAAVLCDDFGVNISSSSLYTGINPTYFWYNNGMLIDSGMNKIGISRPSGYFQNGDLVECQVHTTPNSCVINPIGIAQITLAINNAPTIGVQITPNSPNFCLGIVDTFYVSLIGSADSIWFGYNNVPYYLWQNISMIDTIITAPYSYGAWAGLLTGGYAKNTNGCISHFDQSVPFTNSITGYLQINSDYSALKYIGDTVKYFMDITNLDTSDIVKWYNNSVLVSTLNIKDTFRYPLKVGNNVITASCNSIIACVSNSPVASNSISNLGSAPTYLNNLYSSAHSGRIVNYPNNIVLSNFKGNEKWSIINMQGGIIDKGILTNQTSSISIDKLASGIYIFSIGNTRTKIIR